jgi:polysaccharide biosynthesis protein PslA
MPRRYRCHRCWMHAGDLISCSQRRLPDVDEAPQAISNAVFAEPPESPRTPREQRRIANCNPAQAKRSKIRFRLSVVGFDAAVLGFELLALAVLAWGAAVLCSASMNPVAPPAFNEMAVLTLLFYTLATQAFVRRGTMDRFSYKDAALRSAAIWALMIVFLYLMGILLTSPATLPERWIPTFAVLGIITLPGVRIACVAWGRALRNGGAFKRRSAIVGNHQQACQVAAYFDTHPLLNISVNGLYDDLAAKTAPRAGRHRGGMVELIGAIRAGTIDEVFIAVPPTEKERLATVLQILALTPIRVRQTFDIDLVPKAVSRIALLGDLPFVTLADRPMVGLPSAVKSVTDRIVALALLLFFAPLFLCIAAMIRLDTRGPIFFLQDREGFNCRSFRIWKFRSMYVADCAKPTVVQASKCDPRVTRVGRFLRRFSIDELPQLINVLRGEMSLVGPRPHAVSTCAGGVPFGDVTHTYPARHRLKPGITGWAQVCGLRGETDTQEKLLRRLDHDLQYCSRWSLAFDLRILFLTLFAVPFQRNAY